MWQHKFPPVPEGVHQDSEKCRWTWNLVDMEIKVGRPCPVLDLPPPTAAWAGTRIDRNAAAGRSVSSQHNSIAQHGYSRRSARSALRAPPTYLSDPKTPPLSICYIFMQATQIHEKHLYKNVSRPPVLPKTKRKPTEQSFVSTYQVSNLNQTGKKLPEYQPTLTVKTK